MNRSRSGVPAAGRKRPSPYELSRYSTIAPDLGDRPAVVGDHRRLAERMDRAQFRRREHGLRIARVSAHLVGETELFEEPERAMRARMVQVMDDDHGASNPQFQPAGPSSLRRDLARRNSRAPRLGMGRRKSPHPEERCKHRVSKDAPVAAPVVHPGASFETRRPRRLSSDEVVVRRRDLARAGFGKMGFRVQTRPARAARR